MDANVNQLPDRNPPTDPDSFDPAVFNEKALIPERAGAGTWLKIGGFLTVVVVLTALAINSHQQAPGEAAIPDAPPAVAAVGSATMPAASAPTDRATTGASPAAPARVPAPRQ